MSAYEDRMVNNNLKGIVLEKEGRIDEAILLYEFNVKHRCDGDHPYERLAIIYHRLKRYDDELRVLERAIDVFEHDVSPERGDRAPKLKKFKTRLEKCKRRA